ncbi:WD repeat-containing protein 3 [Iris pallida]|uniref:WD repeat-containing protein 3 n=1 Tax=Iris pallida TaxID=29817 RepID=A0AAX6F424_IRIPA|nr:WD repeat-containing protein 3 [Iris pallida]
MVKSYFRYEQRLSFGVIASSESNICHESSSTSASASGKHIFSPSLDSISVWDIKKGVCTRSLSPSSASSLSVTSIASSSSGQLASGHNDGSIRLWDWVGGKCEATLNGHRSAAAALRYNHQGSLLASGSKDCDIILWDVVAEAGLFRLKGHRDQVTDLVFIDSGKKLVSCSKDKFVRVWDLDMQHCMQIVTGHQSEVWTLDVDPNERFLVTGSADPELRFYQIKHSSHKGVDKDIDGSSKWEVLKQFGEIQRQNKDRMVTTRFNNSGSLLACQSAGKTVEIYRVLDDAEAKKKAKRRVHRKKEKVLAKSTAKGEENGARKENLDSQNPTVVVSDVFKLLQTLRASKKIRSISFSPVVLTKRTLATLSLSLHNNMLETYSIEDNKISKTHSIELQGHRSDVRSVTLSSDSTLLLSTSHNAVKIWNPSTGACIRTVDSGFGLCSSFVPGDRYALIGTNTGTLEIIDVRSGSCTEVIQAHAKSIQSISLIPDDSGIAGGKGFVTGSSDQDVKFWEYQIMQKSDSDTKQLTVTNVRTLKMNDDVFAICISPDAKYIALSLLDCTIKVFYMDSLKQSLSLYGHKLPVLCMDISSDGELIVSGSLDKNLKIWGLDFGDCHKSIFAHADSVMDVKFVRNTHYFFSVGKDHLVKYWDADKFQELLILEGHHAQVWCLAISNRGDFVITGSHDRSIRRWDRTEEAFFLEEEREKRLEQMFESDLNNSNENRYAPKEEFPEEGSVSVPGKRTQETLTATDTIIEALDIADAELKSMEEQKQDKRNIKGAEFHPNNAMSNSSPSDCVLHALCSVYANDLEQSLLSLPFSDALKLISYLKDWAHNPVKVELVAKIVAVLLQTHHNQLMTTPAARPILTVLKNMLHERVQECKDLIGFNLAAMDHLKELASMKSDAPFRDAKAKLMEICVQHSKRLDKTELKENDRKKKTKGL